ncbi:MAG TPA: hypothetical protein PKE69_15625 [Pyrinomonadaceae bacterium]|nr:hypothetical protein [Pyrinomonadaceae bacterium]
MDDNALRDKLGKMLSDGLETDWKNRAYDSESVAKIIGKLEKLAPDDWEQKLIIGGFTDFPYGEEEEIEQSCATCMYYLKHRKYCELPSLDCPVEPEWSCIVWRI